MLFPWRDRIAADGSANPSELRMRERLRIKSRTERRDSRERPAQNIRKEKRANQQSKLEFSDGKAASESIGAAFTYL